MRAGVFGRTARAAVAWLRASAPIRAWVLLGGVLSVGYVATVRSHKLFTPDSCYYSAMALNWAGWSEHSAYATTAIRAKQDGWLMPPIDIAYHYSLTVVRVVYPVLSVPFVRLFGISGLAVVPALSLFLTVGTLLVLLSRRFGWPSALATLLLVACSTKVVGFSSYMITDGLALFWTTAIAAAGLSRRPVNPWLRAGLLVALTTLLAFTRQTTLVPALAFLTAWAALVVRDRRLRNRWALPAASVFVTAAVLQVLQSVLWPGFSQLHQFIVKATHTDNLPDAIRATPGVLWHIVSSDAIGFALNDFPLLVLLLGAIVSWFLRWRREETYLAIGALVAALVYNVTNGTPSGFRYELPALPFLALCFAALVRLAGMPRGEASPAAPPAAVGEPERTVVQTAG